jgi:hypothetical protein
MLSVTFYLFFMPNVIIKPFTLAKVRAIMLPKMTRDSNTLVLALATLGVTTEIETIYLCCTAQGCQFK